MPQRLATGSGFHILHVVQFLGVMSPCTPHVFCWASGRPPSESQDFFPPRPLIFPWTCVFYQKIFGDGHDGSSSSSSSDAVTSSPSRPAASSPRNVFQTVVERLSGPAQEDVDGHLMVPVQKSHKPRTVVLLVLRLSPKGKGCPNSTRQPCHLRRVPEHRGHEITGDSPERPAPQPPLSKSHSSEGVTRRFGAFASSEESWGALGS